MNSIHETVGATEIFNAILKFAKNVQDNKYKSDNARKSNRDSTGTNLNPYGLNRSSIMKASKDLVLSFPVLCTNNITPETAAMVQKAIERNCVTTLQLLFTSANLTGNNGVEVIKQWHNNMDNDVTMDDYFDFIDSVSDVADRGGISKLFENAEIKRIMVENCKANNTYYPQSSFSLESVDNFLIGTKKDGELYVTEAKKNDGKGKNTDKSKSHYVPLYGSLEDAIKKSGEIYDKLENDISSKNKEEYDKMTQHDKELYDQWSKEEKRQNDLRAAQLQRARDEINYHEKLEKSRRERENLDYDRRSTEAQEKKNDIEYKKFKFDQDWKASEREFDRSDKQRDYFTKMLLDTDIKKCNELVPSMMIVNYNALNPATDKLVPQKSFIAGVKARLIGIDSLEIIDRVRMVFDNKVSITNLIRATTGEISFCRDFIAGIDQAKIEAQRNSKLSKTSPIWRSLQNRANKSNFKRISRRTNDAGAITTLVINQEELNYLKNTYKIDMTNIAKCKQLMEFYNLMCFVIVNENAEVVRFLFDGEKFFQDLAFTALERETGDTSYKKIVNLMSQINRG